MIETSQLVSNVFSFIAGIVGIGFLIGFHELGHFLFCKLFSIHTPSFSIGFGPKILSRKFGDTLFSISAIPLGGYVEIAGAIEPGQGEQNFAQNTGEHSFAKKPYWQKLCVVSGGILFNILFAYITFTGLYMIGIPANGFMLNETQKPIIATVEKESPAALADLKPNDHIIAIDKNNIDDTQSLLLYIRQHPEKTVSIDFIRNEKKLHTKTILKEQKVGTRTMGFLGVSFQNKSTEAKSFFSALKSGISTTHYWIKKTIHGFTQLFKQRDIKNISGPIKIIALTAKSASSGITILFILLAIISINLAILNIIPLPVLDGGQALIYTIEALIRRQLPIKVREVIAILNWILMITLFVYLSIHDIKDIFYSYFIN